jgi:hypothetical protein
MAPLRVGLNHVLKNSPSTDGCQHMVEDAVQPRYAGPMPIDTTDLEELVAMLLESGGTQAVIGVSDEPDRSLTTLRFANILRRSADRLCHEAAGHHAAGCRTPVQPGGQRAPSQGVKGRVGRKGTQGAHRKVSRDFWV